MPFYPPCLLEPLKCFRKGGYIMSLREKSGLTLWCKQKIVEIKS